MACGACPRIKGLQGDLMPSARARSGHEGERGRLKGGGGGGGLSACTLKRVRERGR